MPEAQTSMQLRWCGTPLTVTLHSMQMPMPQSGARVSPETEKRQGSSAIRTAAATLAPAAMQTGLPFTVMEISWAFNLPSSCLQSWRPRDHRPIEATESNTMLYTIWKWRIVRFMRLF
jgi:hypothetical protein